MPLTIPRLSVEYVRVPVKATEEGVAVDPTSDVVTMAFTTHPDQPTIWYPASWETDDVANPDRYYARCIVGPGSAVELAPGIYVVWVKVNDFPETPVLRSGELTIS